MRKLVAAALAGLVAAGSIAAAPAANAGGPPKYGYGQGYAQGYAKGYRKGNGNNGFGPGFATGAVLGLGLGVIPSIGNFITFDCARPAQPVPAAGCRSRSRPTKAPWQSLKQGLTFFSFFPLHFLFCKAAATK